MKKDGKDAVKKQEEQVTEGLLKTIDMALSMKLQSQGYTVEAMTGGHIDTSVPKTHYFRVSLEELEGLVYGKGKQKGEKIFSPDELENLEKTDKIEKTVFPATKKEILGERFVSPKEKER